MILSALVLSTIVLQDVAPDTTALFSRIDAAGEQPLDFLRELIQAGEHGEEAVQAIIERRFVALGCEVEVVRVLPSSLRLEKEFAAEAMIDETDRISVVGVCGGTGGGRNLLFFAHPDSPPVRRDGWSKPVFEGMVENRRLYGRRR